MIAAVLKLIILVPTAVPNILAASFPPSDHPMKSPAERKMTVARISICYTPS
jgi:hypothetical protein